MKKGEIDFNFLSRRGFYSKFGAVPLLQRDSTAISQSQPPPNRM